MSENQAAQAENQQEAFSVEDDSDDVDPKVNLTAGEAMFDDLGSIPDIPEDLVSKWKKEYKVIFRIWFIGEQYIYRNFNYMEYKNMRKEVRQEYGNDLEGADEAFKDRIQDMCVLWPQDYSSRKNTGKPTPIPGGIPLLLGDYILAASGFSDSIVPDVINANDGK